MYFFISTNIYKNAGWTNNINELIIYIHLYVYIYVPMMFCYLPSEFFKLYVNALGGMSC